MRSFILFLFLCFYLPVFAQDAKFYDSDVPDAYFDYSLKLVRQTPGFSPPVAARAFGYMGLTLFESTVHGMPGYTSTEGILYELNHVTDPETGTEYHWPTVVNNAMALITDSLFRTMTAVNRDTLYQIRDGYNEIFQYQLPAQVYHNSKAFGEAVATDILDYSRLDGAHSGYASNFPPDYDPPVGPDLWVPYGMQMALQPYWGNNRPFIQADTAIENLSPPPPAFSTDSGSVFYNYSHEVYNTRLNLTPDQETIALYWADGGGTITPGGHSISILRNVLREENANLEEAAIAYAKLGIALSDAFLACWKTKFIYNLCRPVTYIQQHIDSTWTPLIATPPFPEYPSGHSSQSGAMTTVMTDVFGADYAFTDYTHGTNFGGPRTFGSFDEAAEEAAISRLYGGIHYAFGNMAGLDLGRTVGEHVNALFAQVSVGTEESFVADHLYLYPNPVHDVLMIQAENEAIGAEYYVFDVYGKLIDQRKITANVVMHEMGDYAPGLYVIKTDKETSSAHRILKN